MESLTKSEYAAMLQCLQPSQAVTVYTDRLKRIIKVHAEIAEWLAERRRIEEQYVVSLRKLSAYRVPNDQSELGVFRASWDKVTSAVAQTAIAHNQLAANIEKNIETPFRNFTQRDDIRQLNATQTNLNHLAKNLEDAQEKTEKMSKKGGKSAAKLEQASARLESAITEWHSQAPFIFESLQVADESRTNHMRDLLTQYETMELDCCQRSAANATEALGVLVEVSTDTEIDQFIQRTTAGKVKLSRAGNRAGSIASNVPSTTQNDDTVPQTPVQTSQGERPPQTPVSRTTSHPTAVSTPQISTPTSRAPASIAPTSSHGQAPPPTSWNAPYPVPAAFAAPPVSQNDDGSLHEFGTNPGGKHESSFRSRLGTMLGKRRQSIHSGLVGFSQIAGGQKHGRTLGSSHGKVSPRASINDISGAAGHTKLSSLSETSPTVPSHDASETTHSECDATSNGSVQQGTGPGDLAPSSIPVDVGSNGVAAVDEDGYTIRPDAVDPITLAQQEAAAQAQESEQLFKLNIANKPIEEENPDESNAAISNVTSALSMHMPFKRAPTVRGRRDVRNTIYMPPPVQHHDSVGEKLSLSSMFPSPAIPEKYQQQQQQQSQFKPPSLAGVASDSNVTTYSDAQSVRSGTSFSAVQGPRHPELTGDGLTCSIVETVNATFTAAGLKTMRMTGDIAFNYKSAEPVDSDKRETILINNFPNLEAIGPNRIFVQQSPGHNNQYTLDVSYLSRTTTAFTYRVHADDAHGHALQHNLPLLVKPEWTTKGSNLNVRILCCIPDSARWDEIILKNFILSIHYKGTSPAAKSKPSGTHIKDRHQFYWRIEELTLKKGVDEKFICQIVGMDGAPTADRIETRWDYMPAYIEQSLAGISVSRMIADKGKEAAEQEEPDPFVDEADSDSGLPSGMKWAAVPLVFKAMSGKYDVVNEEGPVLEVSQ